MRDDRLRAGAPRRRPSDPLIGLVLDYGLHMALAERAAARGDEATAKVESQEAILTIGRIMAARRRETPP